MLSTTTTPSITCIWGLRGPATSQELCRFGPGLQQQHNHPSPYLTAVCQVCPLAPATQVTMQRPCLVTFPSTGTAWISDAAQDDGEDYCSDFSAFLEVEVIQGSSPSPPERA